MKALLRNENLGSGQSETIGRFLTIGGTHSSVYFRRKKKKRKKKP
jgi:hypothetical protein